MRTEEHTGKTYQLFVHFVKFVELPNKKP